MGLPKVGGTETWEQPLGIAGVLGDAGRRLVWTLTPVPSPTWRQIVPHTVGEGDRPDVTNPAFLEPAIRHGVVSVTDTDSGETTDIADADAAEIVNEWPNHLVEPLAFTLYNFNTDGWAVRSGKELRARLLSAAATPVGGKSPASPTTTGDRPPRSLGGATGTSTPPGDQS